MLRLIFGIRVHHPYKDFPLASNHFHVEISSLSHVKIIANEKCCRLLSQI